MGILTQIIEILTGGLTSVSTAMGSALSNMASSIFLETVGDTTQLSTFGTLIIVFAGIALALGLFRWVLNFVTSMGARNR